MEPNYLYAWYDKDMEVVTSLSPNPDGRSVQFISEHPAGRVLSQTQVAELKDKARVVLENQW